MASSNNYSAMESPKGTRKPFGEITHKLNNSTPSKEEFIGTKDQGEPEGALTPLANLKMLIRVASETNPELPPKRELFRENSDRSEDHDYYSSPSSGHSGLTNLGKFNLFLTTSKKVDIKVNKSDIFKSQLSIKDLVLAQGNIFQEHSFNA